jgi:hypothetical protein
MKQGTGNSRRGDTKVEPKSQAVSLAHVSNIGLKQAYVKTPEPMYKGRGYKAPMVGETSHKSGSQGRHK